MTNTTHAHRNAKSFAQLFKEAEGANDNLELACEREEAFVDWFHAEVDKLDRGEKAQLIRRRAAPLTQGQWARLSVAGPDAG